MGSIIDMMCSFLSIMVCYDTVQLFYLLNTGWLAEWKEYLSHSQDVGVGRGAQAPGMPKTKGVTGCLLARCSAFRG